MESNPDAYRVKILPLLTAIQAVEEGVMVVTGAEEVEEEVEEVVVVVVVVVVEEVVGEVHRHLPPHLARVLQEDEEVVRIVKRTCNNNWKRF